MNQRRLGKQSEELGEQDAASIAPGDTAAHPAALSSTPTSIREILGLQRTVGNRAVSALVAAAGNPSRRPLAAPRPRDSRLQRQAVPTVATATAVHPTPIRADEPHQLLATYQYKKFTIFVPEVVTVFPDVDDLKVHVFFAAGGVKDDRGNDVLVHGLRGASNRSDWVTIAVPGTKDSATIVSDADITDCLRSVGLKTPIRALRLSGHSRGVDSLFASIVQKKITTLSLIDHIYLLDEVKQRVQVLVSMGIPRSKITAYQVNDSAAHVKDVEYAKLPSAGMAAIGYVRLIQDAMAIDPSIASAVAANPAILAQLNSLKLPARGKFTSKTPAGGQVGLQKYCEDNAQAIKAILAKESDKANGLLAFINKHDLVRYSPYVFSRGIAAHHFFVAEIAHELYE